MGNLYKRRVKPIAALLVAIMVLNIYAPFGKRLARAEGGQIRVENLLKEQMDMTKIEDVAIDNNALGIYMDIPATGYSYDQNITGKLKFFIPDKETFTSSNYVFTFDFADVVGYNKDDPSAQSEILDFSKFPEGDLEGPVSIPGSKLPYGTYRYRINN